MEIYNKCTTIHLKANTKNFKDGDKVKVKLTLLDKDKANLGLKEDKTSVNNNEVVYYFNVVDLSVELKVDPSKVKYLKGWIDVDGDGVVEYEEEIESEVAMITKEMLVAMGCVNIPFEIELLDALNKYCPQYEINTCLRVAHFLAQAAHESGGFTKFGEGIHFTFNNALATWPNRKTDIIALPMDRNYIKQPDLFNSVYGARNGNVVGSNDGFNFRGRGLIQITGRTNYTNYQKSHNAKNPDDIKDFVNNESHRNEIKTNIDYAVESACWFWLKNGLNQLADKNSTSVTSITKIVNGGTNGLSDRQAKFDKIKKH